MSRLQPTRSQTAVGEATEATAKTFVLAYRSLPRKARDRVLELLLEAEDLRDHIEGALLWEERKNGDYVSFREVLKQRAVCK
jgi:phytoene/squalene synthetase